MSESRPPESSPREYLTWGYISSLCEIICVKMSRIPFKPIGIIAVSRGGLVPAAIIANKLGIRDVHVLAIQSYEDIVSKIILDKVPKAQPLYPLFVPDIPYKGHLFLVVDDICDSGATQAFIRETWPIAMRACLVVKTPPRLAGTPHIAGAYRPQGQWIVFPWEE